MKKRIVCAFIVCTMKKTLIFFAFLFILCVFAGCSNAVNTAEKPCVLVRGTLYYMSGAEQPETLPEGYLLAGSLEKTDSFPRDEMTGNVPDGSEVYVREEQPEAVYVRLKGSFVCFTVEKLQYTWLKVNGIMYLREDDYRKAYADSPAEGSFDGSLPAEAEYLGKLRSAAPDAFPSSDFQTNFKAFVGYSLYAVPGDPEAVYLRKEPGTSGALRFLRDPCVNGDGSH